MLLPEFAQPKVIVMTSTASSTSSSGPRKIRFNSIASDPQGPGPFPPEQPHVPPTTGGTAPCLLRTVGQLHRPVPNATMIPDGTSTLSSTGCVPAVDIRRQRPDKWKVTVTLRVVETVADHELVGHVEPGVGDVDLHLRRGRLAQHRAHRHRGGVARLEVTHQPGQGESGVDNVLHDQHVPTADVRVEVLQDAH